MEWLSLPPQTRGTFRKSLEATLAAFREGSRVPSKTQVEILEALVLRTANGSPVETAEVAAFTVPQPVADFRRCVLGQLGAVVKSHLIDATKASLFQVRRRAIEMLLPHLSDDE